MTLFNILGIAIAVSNLICIGIFIYRLKYVKDYGLLLLGIFVLLDTIFPVLATVSSLVFEGNVSLQTSLSIVNNVLLLFGFAIVLMLFSNFGTIKKTIAVCIYLIFIGIWLIEFSNVSISKTSTETSTFNYAFVFSKVVTVALCWLYLFEMYLQPHKTYRKIPFFWVVLGWLIAATILSILHLPGIPNGDSLGKDIIATITASGPILEMVLYSIAFWKTKNALLSNQF